MAAPRFFEGNSEPHDAGHYQRDDYHYDQYAPRGAPRNAPASGSHAQPGNAPAGGSHAQSSHAHSQPGNAPLGHSQPGNAPPAHSGQNQYVQPQAECAPPCAKPQSFMDTLLANKTMLIVGVVLVVVIFVLIWYFSREDASAAASQPQLPQRPDPRSAPPGRQETKSERPPDRAASAPRTEAASAPRTEPASVPRTEHDQHAEPTQHAAQPDPAPQPPTPQESQSVDDDDLMRFIQ